MMVTRQICKALRNQLSWTIGQTLFRLLVTCLTWMRILEAKCYPTRLTIHNTLGVHVHQDLTRFDTARVI